MSAASTSDVLQYTMVQGVKCYSPNQAESYTDYPDDGFDVTDKMEEDSFWVRSRNRLLTSIIFRHAGEFKAPRFLEVGCGTGEFIRELVADRRLAITGSEIYLKGLLYAKKKLPSVDFIQYDAAHGLLPDTFDMIAAFDVIEHIDDDVAAITNISRMLAPGGYFIVTVPQHMFLWSRLDEIVMHKRRYSRRELVGKLRAQGFEITTVTSFLFALFPLMMVARLRDRPTGDAVPADGAAVDSDLESRVSFPTALNWIFDKIMRVDEALIRWGVSLPVGGSLLVVARKPDAAA
ncbi:MAG: class I SAM-dependent methyltransferase [Luteimonas sp.]